MRVKTGYKVVISKFDKSMMKVRYHSAIVSTTNAGITYRIGRFALPKAGNGPLAVFDNREDAESFIYTTYTETFPCLFECEYVPSRAKELYRIVKMKYNGTPKTFKRRYSGLPNGTVLATKVKLTKELIY